MNKVKRRRKAVKGLLIRTFISLNKDYTLNEIEEVYRLNEWFKALVNFVN